MLRDADRPQERRWFTPEALEASLKRAAHLSTPQREAVLEAARSDGVSIVEAGAGTGKTTLARAIVDAAQTSNLKVLGLAPSWVAADELAKSTQVECVAVAKWRHDLTSAQARAVDTSTVVLVDEAAMVATRDLGAILSAAKSAGAKVILMGDRRQLESVGGASALKAVTEVVRRGAILDGVRRQQVDWQRAASVLMARGDAEAGLRAYAAHDKLDLVAGSQVARERTVAIWKELRQRHGDDVLIVTRRNEDSAALNRAARGVLKAEGRIEGADHELPAVDRSGKEGPIPLARGDVIRFGENLSHLNIRNGNRARITEIDRDRHGGARIAFRLEDGRQVDVHWQELSGERRGKKPLPPRIVHAYAGTVYSVQGRTAAASVVYVSSPTDAREIYVGLTRHTEDARLVIESERLDAICRQRQTDSRMKPTSADLRDRLFREAMQYREKANVVDYCADRSEFVTTGTIDLPHVDSQKSLVARAVFASRSLRQALTWPEPARLVAPVWRLVEQGRKLTRDLPPELAAVVRAARDRMWLARDRAGRGPSYDR